VGASALRSSIMSAGPGVRQARQWPAGRRVSGGHLRSRWATRARHDAVH
jgi:hypothetical protein